MGTIEYTVQLEPRNKNMVIVKLYSLLAMQQTDAILGHF